MSDFEAFARRLTDRIAEQDAELENLKRRLNNIVREAVVTGVDHEKGKATIKAGKLDSPALPWATRSGDQQEWDPPAKGERVIQLSPTGDPAQGVILPGGYSDQFKQPYNKGKSWFRKVGDGTLLMDGQQIVLKFGDAGFTMNKDGITLSIGSASFKLTAAGMAELAAKGFEGTET